jgi:hypothetical protein
LRRLRARSVWLARGVFALGIVLALAVEPILGAAITGLGLVGLLVSRHGADRPGSGSG